MTDIGGNMGSDRERLHRFNRRKRILDLALVLLSTPITLPLFLLIAGIVRVQQGRPVLFRQERLGYNEQVFHILKFRTMSDARDAEGNLLPDEQRLTPIGTFLRRTSLDELPQLINVLRGEMSLVGPRPLFPRYLPYYTSREATRHLVRPGITGYAQVNGRNHVGWDARLELDAIYVERASTKLDLVILAQTIMRSVRREGIEVIAGRSGSPLNVARTYPKDGALVLRPLEEGDLPERVRWMNDPRTRAYMRLSDDITLESTAAWFRAKARQHGKHDFVVVDSTTQTIVGMVGLRARGARSAESYIIVAPELRGRGLGHRVQRLLLVWAFQSGLYDKVVSSVRRDNTASHRVHARFGGKIVAGEDGRDEIVVDRQAFLSSDAGMPFARGGV